MKYVTCGGVSIEEGIDVANHVDIVTDGCRPRVCPHERIPFVRFVIRGRNRSANDGATESLTNGSRSWGSKYTVPVREAHPPLAPALLPHDPVARTPELVPRTSATWLLELRLSATMPEAMRPRMGPVREASNCPISSRMDPVRETFDSREIAADSSHLRGHPQPCLRHGWNLDSQGSSRMGSIREK